MLKLLAPAFKIQVSCMSTIKCSGNFRIFLFALAICQQWLWHTSVFYQGLWFSLLTVETTCSYNDGWNRRQDFSLWSLCFCFFMCPCYSRRILYPRSNVRTTWCSIVCTPPFLLGGWTSNQIFKKEGLTGPQLLEKMDDLFQGNGVQFLHKK